MDRVELVEALGHQGGDCCDPGGVPKAQGPRLRPRSIIHEGFMEALGLVGP